MNDLQNVWKKTQMADANHLEKVLKLVQYSSRLINIKLKKIPITNFYRHLSMVRRLLRAFRQLSILKSLVTFSKQNIVFSRRILRFIFLCGLLLFFTLDSVVLLSQMKLITNRVFMQRVFDFIDIHWLFQNFIGIIDNLIQISSLHKERDHDKKQFLINDIYKLVVDSGLALSFEFSQLGETFLSVTGVFSAVIGLNNIPAK